MGGYSQKSGGRGLPQKTKGKWFSNAKKRVFLGSKRGIFIERRGNNTPGKQNGAIPRNQLVEEEY